MEKLKSKIVVLNSLRSHFFLVFNVPLLLIMLYLVAYAPNGHIPGLLLIAGLWIVMMLVINKVEILQNYVIIEPWASALSKAGLKSIIEKKQIKSVEYLPGGRFTGEMIIKYVDDSKEKKLYVGITENGAGDIKVIRHFFRNK
ncbi:MAG: hypothetical protein HY364_01810 [Candidatus Aenigmarchaeota archaeon]|nr:hypothetical protein [Candidatus Aenigmarchaeota archaeon]